MEKYDVIIIGAGPSGIALANELLNSNLKVLILDKKKNAADLQYHCTFSSLNLEEWNLPKNISYPLTKFHVNSKKEHIVKKGNLFHSIDRAKLLKFFENKIKKSKNIKLEYNSFVKNVFIEKNVVKNITYLKNNKEDKASAKVFVDCSGLNSIIGKKINLSPKKPLFAMGVEYIVKIKKDSHDVEMFLGTNIPQGYGWILPLNDDNAIVGYGTFSKNHFKNIESHLKKMWNIKRIKERCDPKPLDKKFAIIHTGPPLKKFTKNNVMIIGDSALQVNPLIGEGVKFVMDASKIAAKAIIKSFNTNNFKFLKEYNKNWKKKYYQKYKLGYFIQSEGRRITQNDKITDLLVKKLQNISTDVFFNFLLGETSYINLLKYSPKFLFNVLFKKK